MQKQIFFFFINKHNEEKQNKNVHIQSWIVFCFLNQLLWSYTEYRFQWELIQLKARKRRENTQKWQSVNEWIKPQLFCASAYYSNIDKIFFFSLGSDCAARCVRVFEHENWKNIDGKNHVIINHALFLLNYFGYFNCNWLFHLRCMQKK